MFIKSQRGVIMVMTLIIMLIFTILGAAMYQYSSSAMRESEVAYNYKQAYYIARSGAEAFASYLLNGNPTEIDSDIETIISGGLTSSVQIGEGTCLYNLFYEGTSFIVEAKGTYEGVSASATFEVNKENDGGTGTPINMPNPIFDNVIFSTGNITINSPVNITGDNLKIAANGTITYTGSIPTTQNSKTVYPDVKFPADYDPIRVNYPNLTINYNNYSELSQYYYNNIVINQGGTLNIKHSGNVKIFTIVANEVTINGNLTLQNQNVKVILYTNKLTIGPNAKINVSNPYNQFIVLVPPAATNKFELNGSFNGLLYAPNINTEIKTNSTFAGAMVVGQLNIQQNSTINYASRANLYDITIFENAIFDTNPVQTGTSRYKIRWR